MKKSILIPFLLVCFACNKNQQITNTENNQDHQHQQEESVLHLSAEKFASDQDPICKMPITESQADTASVNGKLYGFCSKDCKKTFLENPDKYLK